MRTILFLLVLFSASNIVVGQTKDTTIFAQGKVINATTKELVSAKISYQSMPYASIVGALTGNTFSIPLYDNEKYAITVEATGFQVYKGVLDPALANAERKVMKDVELLIEIPKAEPVHSVGKVIPLDNLIFAKGSDKIGASSHAQLNEVAKMLQDNPNMIIQIEGHTDLDTKETAKLNMKLSEQRVEAVRAYLVTKGVSKVKVKTKAFGGTQPLYTGTNQTQRALNRRVEARVLEN